MKIVLSRAAREARAHAADAAEVAQVQHDLKLIYALAPNITSEAHLQALLAQIPDGDLRTGVETLLRQFATQLPADGPEPS